MRKASSTALHKSSLLLLQRAATLPLIIPHNELSGVVRSGLCDGHGNGTGDVS